MTDDERIDGALATYSRREPPAGMAERAIGRTRERMAGWWTMGAVAAAGVLAMALHTPVQPTVRGEPRQVREAVAVAEEVRAMPSVGREHRAMARQVRPFPEAPPLTEGERALLAFVASAPERALQSAIEPIVIQEISIEPLEGEGLQK
jgi:hypothetical protein